MTVEIYSLLQAKYVDTLLNYFELLNLARDGRGELFGEMNVAGYFEVSNLR